MLYSKFVCFAGNLANNSSNTLKQFGCTRSSFAQTVFEFLGYHIFLLERAAVCHEILHVPCVFTKVILIRKIKWNKKFAMSVRAPLEYEGRFYHKKETRGDVTQVFAVSKNFSPRNCCKLNFLFVDTIDANIMKSP